MAAERFWARRRERRLCERSLLIFSTKLRLKIRWLLSGAGMMSPLLITLTHECPDEGKAHCVHEECIRALGGVKCAAKREVAGFDIKLTVMLIPVHLWLSAVAAVKNCQNLGQFTSSEQLKPAAAQWIWLFSGSQN